MNYNFIGYGSLMSHRSLRETIPDRKFKLVLVKGYKRVFNLLGDENKKDFLNIIKNRGSLFNGVMFKVNESELRKVKEREDDYNLDKTTAYDFLTRKKIGECFMVSDFLVGIDRKGLLPDKRYFVLCREAAYHINYNFGRFWDKTTFTSKGERISDWIKKNKEFDTL